MKVPKNDPVLNAGKRKRFWDECSQACRIEVRQKYSNVPSTEKPYSLISPVMMVNMSRPFSNAPVRIIKMVMLMQHRLI